MTEISRFFKIEGTACKLEFIRTGKVNALVSIKNCNMCKKNILIILVDSYASLSQFFLIPGSGSTFPEVDPDLDSDQT